MRSTELFALGATVLVAAGCGKNMPATDKEKPNIVFIYADDLGYGDLSCYGSQEINTPNLDTLAANGVKFNDFYSCSPVSSPSRAGLLTGRHPVRQGIVHVFFPNSLQGIDSSEYTMAEMLKDEGYATGIVGKWHLGHLPQFLPMNHGFDYWFGLPYSNDMEWEPRDDPPLPLMRNFTIIDQPTHQPTLTQRYTAEAVNFIARHRDEPFFLYMPHTFPHVPLHVSEEYEGTGTHLYADVVQELDNSVGEVIEALETFGVLENTIVVFSSDNGPGYKPNVDSAIGHGSPGDLRGWKATTFDGGVKVPTIAMWEGEFPVHEEEAPAIMLDWMPTFAEITGASMPQEIPIDGKNITNLLYGKEQEAKRVFFFYFKEELRAVRSGDWKYKKAYPGNRKFDAHGELLFNLADDPNESNNLIDEHPEKAEALKKRMKTFKENLGNIPEPKTKKVPFDDPRDK